MAGAATRQSAISRIAGTEEGDHGDALGQGWVSQATSSTTTCGPAAHRGMPGA